MNFGIELFQTRKLVYAKHSPLLAVKKIFFFAVAWLLFAALNNAAVAVEHQSERFDERVVAEFYRGKVIRIVVGFPPGGGADVYSRLIARHLGRFIPGNPTLAVTNMPGAGSIRSTTAPPKTVPRSACSTAR